MAETFKHTKGAKRPDFMRNTSKGKALTSVVAE